MSKKIKIQEIIPFLKDGWVAMDEKGAWTWFSSTPILCPKGYAPLEGNVLLLNWCFDIEQVDDWKSSLIRVEN